MIVCDVLRNSLTTFCILVTKFTLLVVSGILMKLSVFLVIYLVVLDDKIYFLEVLNFKEVFLVIYLMVLGGQPNSTIIMWTL